MLTISITCSYDGNVQALATVITEMIRAQTGQDLTVRVNHLDQAGSTGRVAAANAANYIKRRPEI